MEFFIPLIASLYTGCITAPINHFYQHNELKHMMNIFQPTLIFATIHTAPKLLQVGIEFPCLERIIIFNSNETVPGTQNLRDFVREQLGNQQILPEHFHPWTGDINKHVAFIMSSSGTSGLSKGVMLTHRNMNVRIAHIK